MLRQHKLKIRKDKQNQHELRTQYNNKQKDSIGKIRRTVQFDSVEFNSKSKHHKPMPIKVIPVKSVAKKLSTEPFNQRKLNHSERTAINKVFRNSSSKKKSKNKSISKDLTKQLLGRDRYQFISEIGKGTFGTVFQARDKKSLQIVAIKKVFQDRKYKNRQLQILKIINHKNILKMKDCFYTVEGQKEYLNVVMDHFTLDMFGLIHLEKKSIDKMIVKLLLYQMFRGLLYLSLHQIAHRDIKPQNILINTKTWLLNICDFGSAKKLEKGQPNISYICSRSYRAPQLIFGETEYNTQIDMWSAGCILVQIVTQQPLFKAKSSSEHLIEIIKFLGSPSHRQIKQMNPQCDLGSFSFPQIPAKNINNILGIHKYGLQYNDLTAKVLKYSPKQRLTPLQALSHSFFDELREQKVYMTLRRQLPYLSLFDFKKGEQKNIEGIQSLIPKWYENSLEQ